MIRTLVLIGLCGAAAISPHAAPQESQNSISGVIDLDLSDPERAFGMELSEDFDAAAIRLRAEAAERDGDYQSAFHHYWAVCEAEMNESCLQAALLGDAQNVGPVPVPLIEHLYKRACLSGYDEACERAGPKNNISQQP